MNTKKELNYMDIQDKVIVDEKNKKMAQSILNQTFKTGLLGLVIGILIGLIMAYIIFLISIDVLGNVFKVEHINITLAINDPFIREITQLENQSIIYSR